VTPFEMGFAAKVQTWRQRAARYRTMSALLGEDESAGRMRALAVELENRLTDLERLATDGEDLAAMTRVLLGEIDAFLGQAQTVAANARSLARPGKSRAADVREEARLCIEEGKAAAQRAVRRAAASRAFALAQLAEEMERDGAR
jgi:hypothetical protein